jgi:hypothetical protein
MKISVYKSDWMVLLNTVARPDRHLTRHLSRVAKLIPVCVIYAALGNSVFSFDTKKYAIGNKFEINMAFD